MEDKSQQLTIESPRTEEEVPPGSGQRPPNTQPGRTRELGAKDNRAFWLTCGCLLVLVGFCVADFFTNEDAIESSKMLESFVDILKYVVTTSLGFFFATTVVKKE